METENVISFEHGLASPEQDLSEDELDEVRNNIALIASEITQGRVGFLFGAGMSTPSGGISGRDLAFHIITESFFKSEDIQPHSDRHKQIMSVVDKYPLEAIAEAATVKLPQQLAGLQEILYKKVLPEGSKPHAGHKALVSLAQAHRIQRIFTTNYDPLIETEFSDGAEAIHNLSDLRKLDKIIEMGKTAVIHLHGSFDRDPIITEFDLMSSQRDKSLFQVFLSELLNKVFVFVGYSLADINIRTIYFKAKETIDARKETKKNNYVVCLIMDKTERRIATDIWKNRGAHLIPIDAESFMLMLRARLINETLKDWKKQIGNRLSISVEDLDKKIEMVLAVFPDFSTTTQVLRYLDAISRRAH
jgi:hypothetical protein